MMGGCALKAESTKHPAFAFSFELFPLNYSLTTYC